MNDSNTPNENFISPNEALLRARNLMLDGRYPETKDDWVAILECWACNLGSDTDLTLNYNLNRLLMTIYEAPLDDDEIFTIVNFYTAVRSAQYN